jgi:LAS superfamily LD-carboxypeptidase LdcB
MKNIKNTIIYISIFISFILSPTNIYALDNRGCPTNYAELQSVSGHKELLSEVARERGYTSFSDAGKVDSSAMSALRRMKDAANNEDKNIIEISGYRSYNDQVGTFFARSDVTNPITRCYTGTANRDEVKRQYLARGEASAPPGFSEHHSGKAFDFNSVEITFENTPEFKWLESNASKYGFRLSYPKNSTKGAGYEPWHWYYVGGGINEDTVNNSDGSGTASTDSSTPSSSASTTAGNVTYQSYTNFPGVGRISDLCQLINALWLLGFAVLLTSVLGMFLWGGYIYVTAGVNAGKVNQAKEIFTNTITGLIIGLSIFIIINIINPRLLQGNCSIPSIGITGTGAGQPTLGGENVLCNVNPNHPWLQKLGSSTLNTGPTGSCVQTSLDNMDRLGIPSFSGGTTNDPNNSRGAMVQLVKSGNWTSCALPGSTSKTISSSYGSIQASVINADAYETLAKNGQIPSGSIIFQTRHGWNYGGGASGNDMGIVRNGGRITHNYAPMSPIIYGDAKEVVILIPNK